MNDDEMESLLKGMPLHEPPASLDARVRSSLSAPLWRRRIPAWQAAAASLALACAAYAAGNRQGDPIQAPSGERLPPAQVTVWLVPQEQCRVFDFTTAESEDNPVAWTCKVEQGGVR